MSILRNILAVIAGIIAGSIINFGIIQLSGLIIPPPEGVDNSTMEGLREGMHLFELKHFLFPFLAHAIGTFAGAIVAALISIKSKMRIALFIGAFFLINGIVMAALVPSPTWFIILDLLGAYIPMAWIAAKLVRKA